MLQKLVYSALHTLCWKIFLFLQHNAFQNNRTHVTILFDNYLMTCTTYMYIPTYLITYRHLPITYVPSTYILCAYVHATYIPTYIITRYLPTYLLCKYLFTYLLYYRTYPLSTMHFHLIWNEWIGIQHNHYTFTEYIKWWLLVDHFHHKPTTIPL